MGDALKNTIHEALADDPDLLRYRNVYANKRTLLLDSRELRLVISGLKRLRHEIRSDMAANNRRGWKPAPGKLDNNALRLEGVNALLKRYAP